MHEDHEDADFEPVEAMDLSGGDVCLDFVNTAGGRESGDLRDKLGEYGDLVTWAERVGLVTEARGRSLRAVAERSPEEADAVLDRARALREATFRLFTRAGRTEADLDLLSDEAGRSAAERRLVAEPDGYAFTWPVSDRLEQLLWPVALSAAELLTSEERVRVKECASDTCEWLFMDMSRNRSRRWCDMKSCGNRAKARRFSARQKRG